MLLANHFDVKKIKKIFFFNPKCQLPITTKKQKKIQAVCIKRLTTMKTMNLNIRDKINSEKISQCIKLLTEC